MGCMILHCLTFNPDFYCWKLKYVKLFIDFTMIKKIKQVQASDVVVLLLQTWLRVSQRFHTISQVVVGAVVGSLFSNLWFWLWDAIVLKAFISYLWIRFIIVFGAVGISLVFFLYIIQHWVLGENWTLCYAGTPIANLLFFCLLSTWLFCLLISNS